MKQVAAAVLLILSSSSMAADTYTQGYTRKDGTYVQPHYSTAPNNSRLDNYSTQGNTNPYTGQQGTQSREPAFNPPRQPSSDIYGQPQRQRSGY